MRNYNYKNEIARVKAEAAKMRLDFKKAYKLYTTIYTPSTINKAEIYAYASGSGAYLKIDTKLGNSVNIQLDPI